MRFILVVHTTRPRAASRESVRSAVSVYALAVALAVFGFASAASAHTANISSSRIVPEPNNHYRVESAFWEPTSSACSPRTNRRPADVDLTEPGVIEGMLGKFVQSRVDLQNEEGRTCASTVVSVGEDPANPYNSKAVLRMDCSAVPGQIFYDPFRLLKAQGSRAKHFVSIGEKGDEAKLTEAQRVGRSRRRDK